MGRAPRSKGRGRVSGVALGPIQDGSPHDKFRPPLRTARRDGPRGPDGRMVPQPNGPHTRFSSPSSPARRTDPGTGRRSAHQLDSGKSSARCPDVEGPGRLRLDIAFYGRCDTFAPNRGLPARPTTQIEGRSDAGERGAGRLVIEEGPTLLIVRSPARSRSIQSLEIARRRD